MNKRKRVAVQKHRARTKKLEERQRARPGAARPPFREYTPRPTAPERPAAPPAASHPVEVKAKAADSGEGTAPAARAPRKRPKPEEAAPAEQPPST